MLSTRSCVPGAGSAGLIVVSREQAGQVTGVVSVEVGQEHGLQLAEVQSPVDER